MKKNLFIIISSLIWLNGLNAQLTLQKINSSKSIIIPLESTIEIKLPSFTSNDSCDCFRSYEGVLKSTKNDTVLMVVKNSKHFYVDSKDVAAANYSSYKYHKKEYPVPIHVLNPLSVSIDSKAKKNLKAFAGIVMTLSAGYAIIGSPFVKEKSRKPLGLIALAGFSTGLTIGLSVSDTKTFHLQQPKNKSKKTLWRLAKSQ